LAGELAAFPVPPGRRAAVFDEARALRIVIVETPMPGSSSNKRRVKAVPKAISGPGMTVS